MVSLAEFPTKFARIDEVGIVVMTVPKAAHTSIMNALVASFASPDEGNRAWIRWRSHNSIDVPSDYLAVGFCRHPLDRFRSCWQDKIATADCVEGKLAAIGGRPGMGLDEFAALVAEADDHDLDRHLIPQHYRFFSDGALRVQELFRYEDLPSAWAAFGDQVRAHCGRDLADLPRLHISKPASWEWSEHSRRMVAQRYARDLSMLGYEV